MTWILAADWAMILIPGMMMLNAECWGMLHGVISQIRHMVDFSSDEEQ